MGKKTNILLLIAVLGVFLVASSTVRVASAYEINGTKVTVDNAKVFFSADPHTIRSMNTVVEYELISKQFTGDIDIAYGFNTSIIRPKKAEIKVGENWIDVSSAFTPVDHEYGDMNKWYFTQSFNVNSGQSYKFRASMRIVDMNSIGKYWICAKPSAQTIQEAIAGGNFLCLDPWWNTSFLNKVPINASSPNGTAPATAMLRVNLTIAGEIQEIYCNLTVGNTSSEIGFVYYNSFDDYVCVEETETSAVITHINEGNGTDFEELPENIVFFGHGHSFVDSSIYNHTVISTNSTTVTPGQVGRSFNFGGTDSVVYDTVIDPITNITQGTMMMWVKWNGSSFIAVSEFIDTNNNMRFPDYHGDDDPGNDGLVELLCRESGSNRVRLITAIGAFQDNGGWRHLAVKWNGSASGAARGSWFIDGVAKATTVNSWIAPYNCGGFSNLFVGSYGGGGLGKLSLTGQLDEVKIFNRTLTDDEIRAIYLSEKGFFGLGNVSSLIPPVVITEPAEITCDLCETLPATNVYCDGDGITLQTYRERTTQWTNNTFMFNQTDPTMCRFGCSNNTISTFGNPGCIESDIWIGIFLIVASVLIVIFVRKVME